MKITQHGPVSLVRRCNRHGCLINVHGHIRMNIPAAGDDEHKLPPLQLQVPLFLCEVHFKDATAQNFQTPEWREQMREVLKKRGALVVPDFENAWLDIVPFDKPIVDDPPHGTA